MLLLNATLCNKGKYAKKRPIFCPKYKQISVVQKRKSSVCLKVLCNTSLNFLQQEEWIYAKCFIETFNWGRDRKVYDVVELSTIRVNFLLWQSPSALNLRVPFQQIFENSQKLLNESFRPDFGLWFSSCVVGGLGPSILPLYKVPSANFSRDKDPFMGGRGVGWGWALYNQNSRRDILALFLDSCWWISISSSDKVGQKHPKWGKIDCFINSTSYSYNLFVRLWKPDCRKIFYPESKGAGWTLPTGQSFK